MQLIPDFRTPRTTRVAVVGQTRSQTEHLWLVLHGYGQLVTRFAGKFEGLGPNHLLYLPEAMQRFYVDGQSGKVGATWMTREDRLSDIADNHEYLDTLWAKIQHENSFRKFHAFGFSQGCATLCRWLSYRKIKPDTLTLWAGMWAEDLDPADLKTLLSQTKLTMVIGNQDHLAGAERMNKMEKMVKDWGIEYELLKFEGGHHVDKTTFELLASRIAPTN